VDCLTDWKNGNLCGVPAGPKTNAVSSGGLMIQFETAGEYVLTSDSGSWEAVIQVTE
jgi:hypothetical protein